MEQTTEVIDAAPAGQDRSVPVAQQSSQVSAGPLAQAMQALQAGVSVADMRALLDLQRDYEAGEARKAYVADMAGFKRNPPEILKRKLVHFETQGGGATSYMHATLGDVTTAIVEGLAEHGFSHRWDTKQEGGRVVVTCIITHKLGHSETTTLDGAPDTSGKKNSIQQMASTVTYLQRYTLLAATGLATKDQDDDGSGGARAEPAVPEARPEDGEAPPQMLADARDAAMQGVAAFNAFYRGPKMSEKNRRQIAPHLAGLRAAAAEADLVPVR